MNSRHRLSPFNLPGTWQSPQSPISPICQTLECPDGERLFEPGCRDEEEAFHQIEALWPKRLRRDPEQENDWQVKDDTGYGWHAGYWLQSPFPDLLSVQDLLCLAYHFAQRDDADNYHDYAQFLACWVAHVRRLVALSRAELQAELVLFSLGVEPEPPIPGYEP